jgi:hypothetical protein
VGTVAAGAPATPGAEGAGDAEGGAAAAPGAEVAGDAVGGAAGDGSDSESESDGEQPGGEGARPGRVAARPEAHAAPKPGGGPRLDRPGPSVVDGEARTGGEGVAAGTC